MTDTETKLHDAIMQFDLAANSEDEARVRGTVPGIVAGATMIFWRFDGAAEYLGPNDSGGMQRLSMRYLGLLRGLVSDWLQKRAELRIL